MMKKHISGRAGQIRIIGGQWRGRKLPVPDSPGLRPTTDPVRETLFNWLAPWIVGAHCMDCFAGSGALGLEALSRGAEQVILLENERLIARQLEQNLAVLRSQQGRVICDDTLRYLARADLMQPQSIVFVDPPFRQKMLSHTLHLLDQGWLAEEALIYVESECEQVLAVPAGWQLLRGKNAGQVAYRLYCRRGSIGS